MENRTISRRVTPRFSDSTFCWYEDAEVHLDGKPVVAVMFPRFHEVVTEDSDLQVVKASSPDGSLTFMVRHIGSVQALERFQDGIFAASGGIFAIKHTTEKSASGSVQALDARPIQFFLTERFQDGILAASGGIFAASGGIFAIKHITEKSASGSVQALDARPIQFFLTERFQDGIFAASGGIFAASGGIFAIKHTTEKSASGGKIGTAGCGSSLKKETLMGRKLSVRRKRDGDFLSMLLLVSDRMEMEERIQQADITQNHGDGIAMDVQGDFDFSCSVYAIRDGTTLSQTRPLRVLGSDFNGNILYIDPAEGYVFYNVLTGAKYFLEDYGGGHISAAVYATWTGTPGQPGCTTYLLHIWDNNAGILDRDRFILCHRHIEDGEGGDWITINLQYYNWFPDIDSEEEEANFYGDFFGDFFGHNEVENEVEDNLADEDAEEEYAQEEEADEDAQEEEAEAAQEEEAAAQEGEADPDDQGHDYTEERYHLAALTVHGGRLHVVVGQYYSSFAANQIISSSQIDIGWELDQMDCRHLTFVHDGDDLYLMLIDSSGFYKALLIDYVGEGYLYNPNHSFGEDRVVYTSEIVGGDVMEARYAEERNSVFATGPFGDGLNVECIRIRPGEAALMMKICSSQLDNGSCNCYVCFLGHHWVPRPE